MKTVIDETLDVRSHFGFTKTPFTRELGVAERWTSPIYDEVIDELYTTIAARLSAVLVAPSGTGKTSVLRAVLSRLPEARYRAHYVKVTSLGMRDFCREIAVVAGVEPAGTYPMLVRRLEERFESTVTTDGLRPVLVIDEAHDMRPDVLAIVRILTNYQMDSRLVLSLVLCGQPPLLRMLQREDLEAVSRRMSHIAQLRLLSRPEAKQYMEHRARIAGIRKLPFDELAIDAVHEVSRGNLRAIDHLALKSLEIATRQDAKVVDASIVAEARTKLL
jgi:type II secretory pathway predicted ATPase ExeA